jgi:Flp pilus assembly pilin Flp
MEVIHMLKLVVAAQCRAMDFVDDLRTNEEGQTMAEYGVVLAVITLVIVGTLLALSGAINGALGRVEGALK